MPLIRLKRKGKGKGRLMPPATKSGRLTPSKMRDKIKRERVWTNEDVDFCRLEYIDVEQKKRAYYATMKDGTRKRLTRCTKIAGMLISDRVVDWAARMAAEHVLANWEARRRYSQAQINDICAQAKTAHEDYKNLTGDLGTEAHELIEKFLHTGLWPAEFAYLLATGEWADWAKLDPRVGNSLVLFYQAWKKLGLRMVETEYRVFDVSLMVGGTADCIAIDEDGNYVLIDYKTGNGIYESHLVQIAFYWMALLRMGELGFPIKRVIIIRIGRTDAIPQIYEVPQKYLDMAFQTFEALAAARPSLVTLDGVLAKERTAWRADNNMALEEEDTKNWEADLEEVA